MEDDIHAFDGFADGGDILHVAANELDLAREIPGHLAFAVHLACEAVEYADLMALRQQRVHGMGPDEPCASGDEHALRHHAAPASVSCSLVRACWRGA